MHPRLWQTAPAALILGLVCGQFPGGPGGGSVAETGLLVSRSDTAETAVPDSARIGEPFEVRVTTFAGGCTREIARTDVRTDGLVAEIRPYDRRRSAEVCTDDLLFLEHRARIRFDSPGTALVRFIGLRLGPPADSAGPVDTRPVTLERRVTVAPAAP